MNIWKIFDKYMNLREKVSKEKLKKFNSKVIYHKKYLKAEKKIQHKGRLSMFLYTTNIDWFSL